MSETATPKSEGILRRLRRELDGQPKGRILVVDDFAYDRELLTQGLTQRKYVVSSVETGEEAIEKVTDCDCYDILLLDSQMPGMDGADVLRILREKYTAIDLPVIMVTGMDQPSAIIEALRIGANDYVTKPVDIDVIAARVETQLSITRLRAALQEEQEFSQSLIDSSYEMIIATDMQRRVTLLNPAAERILGYEHDEVIGKLVDMLYADADDSVRIHGTVLAENAFIGEIRNKRRNGEIFFSHLSASIQRDKHGNPLGYMAIAMDLTEIKRLEEEREQLIKTKEEFLVMASHDLNNPLTSILGFASILEKMVPPGAVMNESSYECFANIKENVHRMHKIIEDFIDFHKMEESRLWLARVPTQLEEMAAVVIRANEEPARQKEVTLKLEADENLPVLNVDADRIERVMRNLVGNAVKFCPPGCHVRVVITHEDEAVKFAVIDNGPGLSTEDLPRTFRKFERLSNRPTGGEKSSGLGLAICKQLIDLHNGQIGVHNNPDQGATFWFTLPL